MIEFKITGVNVAQTWVRDLPPNVAKDVVLRMSQIAYDAVQLGADRHTKTGALFQSVYNRQIPNGREVGHDPTRAPYAQFVIFGTRPHVIRPKNKKALRWPAGAGFRFAKFVNHPGYRGDDYMTTAADYAVRQFANLVDQSLKDNQ